MVTAGTRLGTYEVVERLGAGGMGEVWRARDARLGRDVALKLLPDDVAHDPDRRRRFEREARLLAALNHPSIATLHGFEQADGLLFLVMELVEGRTLAEKVLAGPLPMTGALDLARQIADAIEAAHERGILHRDLKPQNIKVTPEGRVKLLDFGLGKVLEAGDSGAALSERLTATTDSTSAGSAVGTAPYMSPEQAKGQAVDRRTDVWAFGCVLFEMLSGRRAFPGPTRSEAIAAVLELEREWSLLPADTPTSVRTASFET
jgi:serine/threonine protein kinase